MNIQTMYNACGIFTKTKKQKTHNNHKIIYTASNMNAEGNIYQRQESLNTYAAQKWEKQPSPKQQNTPGIRIIKHNGIKQKSFPQKKTVS